MERLQFDYESPQARVVQIEAEGALAFIPPPKKN